MKPAAVIPLRAVECRPVVDAELLNIAEGLLEAIKAGECNGIVFAVSMRDGDFICDVSGVYYANPTLARGVLAYVADQVAGLQHRARRAHS